MSSCVSMLAQREKQQQFRSLSSPDLGSTASAVIGSPTDTWSKWVSSSGNTDWAVNTEEFCRPKRSSSFELANNGEEPDLSWVQSLVKESPQDLKDKAASCVLGLTGSSADPSEDSTSNFQIEQFDQLSAWMEQMKLDKLMAQ